MKSGKWSNVPMVVAAVAVVAAIAVFYYFATGGCEAGVGERDKKDVERLPTLVNVFKYKGHEYFYIYHGGVFHSESCPCHERKVTK